MPEDQLYGASAAAAYLGISVARLNEIRTTRAAANQEFGMQITGGRWVYRQSELDAYKAQREERPKGGRPKSEGVIMSPVISL